MNTTLKEILEKNPCDSGWTRLLRNLGKAEADDEVLSFNQILRSNGIKDAIWALRVLPYDDRCVFCADVAESVLHIYESRYSDDRPRRAVQSVRDYKKGVVSREELAAANANANANAAYAAAACDAADDATADNAAAAAYTACAATADDAAADDTAAVAVADAVYTAYAYADAAAARIEKWLEIEVLFIEHFCKEAQE